MRKGFDADVLVVGAGIFGLSCAWACARRGMRVIVADAVRPGAGASGGLVGALSPHAPEPWSPRKRFQLDALVGGAALWAEVAAAGGVDPGYARVGRLTPLGSAAARARAEVQAAAAAVRWGEAASWRIVPAAHAPCWLAPEAAAHGAILETLSARLSPRAAVAALVAALAHGGAELRCGWRALGLEDQAVGFDRGRIVAPAVILAAGVGVRALATAISVEAVKGQAALLAAAAPMGAPLIFGDGIYVTPQFRHRVAVGSTSEIRWTDPATTDAGLEAVVARARMICPPLRDAPVVERWAGLRPRGARPDPVLGPLPGAPGVFVAAGAFKTGFGLAPAVGAALAAMVGGEAVELPPGFSVADHLKATGKPRATSGDCD